MTDAEIVALVARAIELNVRGWDGGVEGVEDAAAAVVAALTEAGRLLPAGCVAIDAGRWDRVMTVLNDCAAASVIEMVDDAMATLEPGDLDAEPTP